MIVQPPSRWWYAQKNIKWTFYGQKKKNRKYVTLQIKCLFPCWLLYLARCWECLCVFIMMDLWNWYTRVRKVWVNQPRLQGLWDSKLNMLFAIFPKSMPFSTQKVCSLNSSNYSLVMTFDRITFSILLILGSLRQRWQYVRVYHSCAGRVNLLPFILGIIV